MTAEHPVAHSGRLSASPATRRRRLVAGVFALVVVGHWAEHLLQAVQIWWLGWPRPAAGGALGLVAPQAVDNELLHTGYNAALLVGIVLLYGGFQGRARRWWTAALAAQGWHLAEHLLLWSQAVTGARPFGTDAPASLVQLVVPRVELHLAYNTAVTALLVAALIATGSLRLLVNRPPGKASTRSNADSNTVPRGSRHAQPQDETASRAAAMHEAASLGRTTQPTKWKDHP